MRRWRRWNHTLNNNKSNITHWFGILLKSFIRKELSNLFSNLWLSWNLFLLVSRQLINIFRRFTLHFQQNSHCYLLLKKKNKDIMKSNWTTCIVWCFRASGPLDGFKSLIRTSSSLLYPKNKNQRPFLNFQNKN